MGTKKLVRGFTKKRHGEEDNDRNPADHRSDLTLINAIGTTGNRHQKS